MASSNFGLMAFARASPVSRKCSARSAFDSLSCQARYVELYRSKVLSARLIFFSSLEEDELEDEDFLEPLCFR